MDKMTRDTLLHQASLLDQMARELHLRSDFILGNNHLLISDEAIASVLKQASDVLVKIGEDSSSA